MNYNSKELKIIFGYSPTKKIDLWLSKCGYTEQTFEETETQKELQNIEQYQDGYFVIKHESNKILDNDRNVIYDEVEAECKTAIALGKNNIYVLYRGEIHSKQITEITIDDVQEDIDSFTKLIENKTLPDLPLTIEQKKIIMLQGTETIEVVNTDIESLLLEYKELTASIGKQEKRLDEIKNILIDKTNIKNANKIVMRAQDYAMTLTRQVSNRFDSKALERAYPQTYKDYLKESTSYVMRIVQNKFDKNKLQELAIKNQ